jgi:hypothetical protein
MRDGTEIKTSEVKAWSALDIADLRYGAAINRSAAEIAKLLNRSEGDVQNKAAELGLKLD